MIATYTKNKTYNKKKGKKVVNQATKSNIKTKAPVNYFPEETESTYEDNRASDLSYNPNSDTDTASVSDTTDSEDSATQEEPLVPTHAHLLKYFKPLPLSHKPNHTPTHNHLENSSTKTLTEPHSPENPTLTEPHSPENPTLTEPHSPENLTLNEPYSPENLTSPDNQAIIEDSDNFNIPTFPIVDKAANIEALKADTKSDPTLKVIRGLAHHSKNGYTWDKGLLYHISLDPTIGEKRRLVIPTFSQLNSYPS